MNTMCKYNKGRSVPIGMSDSFSYTTGYFNMILLKKGYLSLNCGNTRYIINGPSLLCLPGDNPISMLYVKGEVASLSFAPQFINVHLNNHLIRTEQYAEIAKRHRFPTFDLFLHRSDIYGGVLPLNETSLKRATELFSRINVLLTVQPTFKWSCKTRAEIFQLFDIANFNLELLENGGSDISDLLEAIHAKIDTNLSLVSLFKQFNTTAPTVSRKFKIQLGMTAINYVLSLRLNLCSYVLAFTDINVNEIAASYEFNDSAYFARMFKRQFGLTPNDYRVEQRAARDELLK